MHKKSVWATSCGLLFLAMLMTVFLSPPGETIQAFNQSNLIRAAEIREVDGKLMYRRVAPVTDMRP